MCISKLILKTHDSLDRPLNLNTVDELLWNDKCDYLDPEICTNLNPNNYNLIVLQLNIRSLPPNQTELKQLLQNLENHNSRVDVILLCELFKIPIE